MYLSIAKDSGRGAVSRRACNNEAEHEVFPRPPITHVPQVPSPELRATKTNLSDGVARQIRLKRCMHQRGGTQDVFRRPCDKDVALAGHPALLHENRLSPSLAHDIMR